MISLPPSTWVCPTLARTACRRPRGGWSPSPRLQDRCHRPPPTQARWGRQILTLFTANSASSTPWLRECGDPRRLAGHIEPLTYSTFLLTQGRELDIVTQAETLEPLISLREDLERLGRGLYAAELVDRFTPDRQKC